MINFIGNNLLPYENISNGTVQECLEYISKQKVIAIDIETSRKYRKGLYPEGPKLPYQPGLDPYMSNIVMLQIGTLEKRFVIDARVVDISILKPILEDETILKVGHNLKFEYKFFYVHFGIRMQNIWDTMLTEKVLTNGLDLRYSLAALAERYLHIAPSESVDLFTFEKDDNGEALYDIEDQLFIDKSIRLGFINIGDKPFTLKQILYGEGDIIYPLQIRELQLKNKYFPSVCIALENEFCLSLAEVESVGMDFDSQQWLQIYADRLPLFQQYENKLKQYVVDNHPDFSTGMDLFSSEPTCSLMWTSSDQVVKLFRKLEICPKERSKQTKQFEYTVGAAALLKILDKDHKEAFYKKQAPDVITNTQELILLYLSFKREEQAVTTFGKEWLKYVHPITRRVHSSYRQILNTGRISSTNPNLQNIPADVRYRKCFIAPKGYKVVNADYSSQEIRVLADVSGVQEMIDFFILGDKDFGDDFHSFTATKMFRIIYNDPKFVASKKTKRERDVAKAINFKLSYGGSAFTLKDDFGVSEEEAQQFINNYFDSFPGLQADFKKVQKFALEHGYIVIDTYTQRRWFCPYYDKMKAIEKEIWTYYPKDYRQMSAAQRQEVKTRNKIDFPFLGEMWSQYFYYKGQLERAALNFRIQGLSGGMTKLAAILLRNWKLKNGYDKEGFINNLIHDEINSLALDDLTNTYKQKMEEVMARAGTFFCRKVPMTAEAVEGDYWGH